jgi:hypothetical protein
MSNEPERANVLPSDAVRMLTEAARTPVSPRYTMARVIAIEEATAKVKAMYPDFFRMKNDEKNTGQ